MHDQTRHDQLTIAIAQLPITGDVRQNGAAIRRYIEEAVVAKARLIQFPEGMLSGYAKEQIQKWSEVDWQTIHEELEGIMALAAKHRIWVVLGSAHMLTSPHLPHNSLYIISDEGKIINRYDKRICSYTEVTRFYTPGSEPVVFDVDGFRFGTIICIEINFPKLFMEYSDLGVDCVLFSAYPVDAIYFTKARAHAAIYNIWVGLSTPTNTKDFITTSFIDPRGEAVRLSGPEGLVIATMDRTAPELDIALNKSRPWRHSVATSDLYKTRQFNDPRSVNRICY